LTFGSDSIAACGVISSDYFFSDEASFDVLAVRIMIEILFDVVRLLECLFFGERAVQDAALSI